MSSGIILAGLWIAVEPSTLAVWHGRQQETIAVGYREEEARNKVGKNGRSEMEVGGALIVLEHPCRRRCPSRRTVCGVAMVDRVGSP